MKTWKEVEVTGNARIDITLEDVLDFINQANVSDFKKIIREVKITEESEHFTVKTLYDKMKIDLLQEAFKKLSLQELETKLGNL